MNHQSEEPKIRGFMNAELEALMNNLECGNCHAKFKGSASQADAYFGGRDEEHQRARECLEKNGIKD